MLLHFFRSAPFRELLALRVGQPSSVMALWIDRIGTQGVFSARQAVLGFEDKIQLIPEAPRFEDATSSSRRQFATGIRRLFDGLGNRPAARLVVDAAPSEVFVNLMDLRGAREKREAQHVLGTLKNAPSSVLGRFSGTGEWRWSLFTRQLEPITSGTMPDEVVVVGLSVNSSRRYEKWAEAQGIELLAILPAAFAVMAWALRCVGPHRTAVLVAFLAGSTLRLVCSKGQVLSLRLGDDAGQTDESARGQLEGDGTLGIRHDTPWYVWRRTYDEHAAGDPGVIDLSGAQMEAFAGASDQLDPLKAPSSVAPMLAWLASH